MRDPLERAEQVAKDIGKIIGSQCPPGWSFALILASQGEGGFMTYVSNAMREDMVRLLRETADKIERGEPNV